jgi:hypothetical protein
MIQTERLEHRAREAVARTLIRVLTVPNVYFEAPLVPHRRIDVVAVDRAGSGDVHAVEIKRAAKDAISVIPQLLAIPCPFKWTAFFSDTLDPVTRASFAEEETSPLVAPQGMGRVGIIEVFTMQNGDLGSRVLVRPERFAGSFREEQRRFISENQPDIQLDSSVDAVEPPTPYRRLDESTVRARLEEVARLDEAGHAEAAFLLAWATAEAVMRLIAEREGLRSDRSSPLALIRSLHSVGIVGEPEQGVLTEAGKVRNAVVHGFGADRPFPTADLLSVLAQMLSAKAAGQGA